MKHVQAAAESLSLRTPMNTSGLVVSATLASSGNVFTCDDGRAVAQLKYVICWLVRLSVCYL